MYRVWACDNAHTTNLSAEHIDNRVCHYPLILLLAYLSIQASWQPTRLHKWPQINLRGLQSAYLYFNSGHKPTWHWNPSSLCTEPTNYDSDYKQSTWNVSTRLIPEEKLKGHCIFFLWAVELISQLDCELLSFAVDTCLVSNVRDVHDASLVVLTEPKSSTAMIPEIMTQFLKIIHRPRWVQFHVYLLLLSNCTVSLHKSKHASTYKCEASWESWLTFQVWTHIPPCSQDTPAVSECLTASFCPSMKLLASIWFWGCSLLSALLLLNVKKTTKTVSAF